MGMFLGAIIYAAGFFTCYFFVRKPDKPVQVQEKVKRVRTSLRNPMRTYEVNYEPYKSKDTNLYQPVKPKRKSAVNEVDTDGV